MKALESILIQDVVFFEIDLILLDIRWVRIFTKLKTVVFYSEDVLYLGQVVPSMVEHCVHVICSVEEDKKRSFWDVVFYIAACKVMA